MITAPAVKFKIQHPAYSAKAFSLGESGNLSILGQSFKYLWIPFSEQGSVWMFQRNHWGEKKKSPNLTLNMLLKPSFP